VSFVLVFLGVKFLACSSDFVFVFFLVFYGFSKARFMCILIK